MALDPDLATMSGWYPEVLPLPHNWKEFAERRPDGSNMQRWELVKTPSDFWSIDDLKKLSISPHSAGNLLEQVLAQRTRWIADVYKQCIRAKTRGRTAILNLVFCPVGNKSNLELDNPNNRSEKVISAFEMENGPLVVSLNMRSDCRRVDRKQYDNTRYHSPTCLSISDAEWLRCLEMLVLELKFAKEIAGVEFVSVVTMSSV
jgi:hypothetical protein